MSNEKKLSVRNLKISFRTQGGILQAVRDVSFDLYKGETLAIVGESGSGKSVTNRAIMGILAGNGFVDSGEIVYDGQDLVQITEEDFHKIRGDKIAMIFQDPMSSLNPIMKIGKQLTEAMLLKNTAQRKNARDLFNKRLSLLNKTMDELDSANVEKHKELCTTFDNFCINQTKLAGEFNTIHNNAEELKLDVDDFIFLVEKKQKVEAKRTLNEFAKRITETYHPRVVVKNEETENLIVSLREAAKSVKKGEVLPETLDQLRELSNILDNAINLEKPNYFCIGYYKMTNPNADVDTMPVAELNKMVREYLDQHFMLDFIEKGKETLQYSHNVSKEKQKALISELQKAHEFFSSKEIDEQEAKALAKKLGDDVTNAIDELEIVKSGREYIFHSSINNMVKKYFNGIKRNAFEKKRYEQQKAKYDKLIAKGKKPDWSVVEPAYFDLEMGQNNILHLIEGIIEHYQKEDKFNANDKMVAFVDYLKEQADNLVYKVTKKTAKAKALKLLDEVGIPEPSIRYNQYPFEFSGGMRQRIVIAIALAANPDILICDEPTTALDVTIQAQILELINKLKKERQLSVIFITHNLGVVANMADRIAVMYAGKIVEEGTAEEIFYDPRHPYTWALLSSMPDLDTKDKLEAIPGTPPNMIYPPKGDAFAARNKYALEIDFEEQPPMFEITKTHKAATWLLHPNAPKIAIPKNITDRIERMKKKGAQK